MTKAAMKLMYTHESEPWGPRGTIYIPTYFNHHGCGCIENAGFKIILYPNWHTVYNVPDVVFEEWLQVTRATLTAGKHKVCGGTIHDLAAWQVQRVWRVHMERRRRAAVVIRRAVLEFLYRPGGAMYRRGEMRFNTY